MKPSAILPKTQSQWVFALVTLMLALLSYLLIGVASGSGRGFALIIISIGVVAGNIVQVRIYIEKPKQQFSAYTAAVALFILSLIFAVISITGRKPGTEMDTTTLEMPPFPASFPSDADNCTPFVLGDSNASGERLEFVILMPSHVGDYFEIRNLELTVKGESFSKGIEIPKGGPWVEAISFTPQGDPRSSVGESSLKIRWNPLTYPKINDYFNKTLDLRLRFDLSYAAPLKGKNAYAKVNRAYDIEKKLLLVSEEQVQIFHARSQARENAIRKVTAANSVDLPTLILVLSALLHFAATILLATSLPLIQNHHLIWSGEIWK